ncbi:MAG: tRNA (cytidine(34)-2'-O)-methyltransferase [Planctomycetota bacterium]
MQQTPAPTANVPGYEPWLHVVLHEPEIAYNTGSVGRTCVALGAKLWLVRPLGFTIDDRQLRRAGLDYWAHLAWEAVEDWAALCERLPVERAWCFTKFADRSYADAEFRRGDVLVFGSESRGLPDSIHAAAAGRRLRIPTRPEVRSLNLSNSVAIAGYEALRQAGGPAAIAGLAESFPES